MRDGWPALPTGTKINPTKPEEADFYDPNQVHYIVAVEKAKWDAPKFRDWTSFGELTRNCPWDGPLLNVGDWMDFRHDQTDKNLGGGPIVGIVLPGGETRGVIPDKKMPHWVAK